MVGSSSSISSGPKPGTFPSSTSSMRRSRSIRLRSGFSVSHRRSTTRRISRRRVSPARSLTRDRSSLSTSLLWMSRLSSSKLLLDWFLSPASDALPSRLWPPPALVMPVRPRCNRDMDASPQLSYCAFGPGLLRGGPSCLARPHHPDSPPGHLTTLLIGTRRTHVFPFSQPLSAPCHTSCWPAPSC